MVEEDTLSTELYSPPFNPKDITSLIYCKKYIISKPTHKDKSNVAHTETQFYVESEDKTKKYIVFIRQNKLLIENFSIGLIYLPIDGNSIILTRYNGSHGGHVNAVTKERFKIGCHIHIITSEAYERGILAENYAKLTDKYISLHEAKFHFFKDMQILNAEVYFPEIAQTMIC